VSGGVKIHRPFQTSIHTGFLISTPDELHIAEDFTLHNHPSGDPTPSREDREITRRLKEAGELMGVAVLDHIIIGDGRYISFTSQGIM
jgi:DNA repair protein RadC